MHRAKVKLPTLSRRAVLAACMALLLSAAPPVRAEPLPPELNLIPRHAGFFVSVRVADFWNDPRAKALRDLAAKQPELLKRIENESGFRPENLERLTLFVSAFNERRGPGEPIMVLTFSKPYDLDRLLDVMGGMSPEEWRTFEEARRPKSTKFFKREFPEPQFKEKKPEFPRPPMGKFEFKEPVKARPHGESFIAADKEGPDAPVKTPAKKRNLKANYYVLRDRRFLVPINDRTIVVCPDQPYARGREINELLGALLRRSDDGPLAPALEAAAGKHVLVAGVNLASVKSAIPTDFAVELLPIQSILSSRTASIIVDLGDELKLTLRVDAPDPATAKRVHDVLKALHVLGLEMLPGVKKQLENEEGLPLEPLFGLLEPMFRDAAFEQKESVVTMTTKVKVNLAAWSRVFTDSIEKTRQATEAARAMNNLKQIGLAVHNYASAYQDELPFPGIPDRRADPQTGPKLLLSWRVALLPYIEHQNLYLQFHLDEPWDSEHNKKLIEMMPKIYAPLGGAEAPKGYTFYRAFTGPHTISGGYKIGNIPDGTSNTIMVVEAGEAVPWTKPDDFPFDPEKPLPKLGGHFKGKMLVAMADGSVRLINLKKTSERTLKLAIQADDGGVLPTDW